MEDCCVNKCPDSYIRKYCRAPEPEEEETPEELEDELINSQAYQYHFGGGEDSSLKTHHEAAVTEAAVASPTTNSKLIIGRVPEGYLRGPWTHITAG